MNAPIDCRHCGVCCFSQLDTYVRVMGADWSRLGDQAERVAHFIGHRAFLKMQNGHCAALEIERKAGEFCCAIYDCRPQICRDLLRDSPQCLGELATKGGRPAVARAVQVDR
jgi:Fe-S-cluster containining protein